MRRVALALGLVAAAAFVPPAGALQLRAGDILIEAHGDFSRGEFSFDDGTELSGTFLRPCRVR